MMKKEFSYAEFEAFSRQWISKQGKSFTSEDLKREYLKKGFPEPTKANAFGFLFQKLSREEKIFKIDYRQSDNPVCRKTMISVWISREYRLTQQKNATKDKSLKLNFDD